jgi:hypothetical protein
MLRFHRVFFTVLLSSSVAFVGCTSVSPDKPADAGDAPKPSEATKVDEPKATAPAPAPVAAEPPVSDKLPAEAPKAAPPAAVAEPEPVPAVPVPAAPPGAAPPAGKTPAVAAEPPPKKTGPNNFVVTVAPKTSQHPFFGKGHPLGLVVDGVEGQSLVLRRGQTYEFAVQTDAKHDVYFSTSPLGWGGGAVTEGIKGQFTYSGTITVTPGASTPDVIYYQCRNHSSMGGKVVVANANATKAEIEKLVAASAAPAPTSAASGAEAIKEVPVDTARQKIMLAEMMLQSKNAKAVAAGPDGSGKASIVQAAEKLQTARKEVDAGHSTAALKLAEESLLLISNATRSMSSEDAARQKKAKFAEVQETLRNFRESHKQNYERTVKKRGKSAAVDYDHAQVDALVATAKSAADKGEYDAGIESLTKAEHLVTRAIQSMLDSQTIVYDLNFDTPADEYDYERKRFIGYEELIPVAIEEKKPTEAVIKLMDTYVEKGRAQKAEAEQRAKAGNYPDAISLMLSATEEIRRALRLAGVSQ